MGHAGESKKSPNAEPWEMLKEGSVDQFSHTPDTNIGLDTKEEMVDGSASPQISVLSHHWLT